MFDKLKRSLGVSSDGTLEGVRGEVVDLNERRLSAHRSFLSAQETVRVSESALLQTETPDEKAMQSADSAKHRRAFHGKALNDAETAFRDAQARESSAHLEAMRTALADTKSQIEKMSKDIELTEQQLIVDRRSLAELRARAHNMETGEIPAIERKHSSNIGVFRGTVDELTSFVSSAACGMTCSEGARVLAELQNPMKERINPQVAGGQIVSFEPHEVAVFWNRSNGSAVVLGVLTVKQGGMIVNAGRVPNLAFEDLFRSAELAVA